MPLAPRDHPKVNTEESSPNAVFRRTPYPESLLEELRSGLTGYFEGAWGVGVGLNQGPTGQALPHPAVSW